MCHRQLAPIPHCIRMLACSPPTSICSIMDTVNPAQSVNPIVYVYRFPSEFPRKCAERHFRAIKPVINGGLAELDLSLTMNPLSSRR